MIATLPRLHAVTDDRVIAEGRVALRATAMAEAAGPALAVHLRSRALEGGAFTTLAKDLAAALRPQGSWLVVNGRPDVARIAGARAVVSGRGGLAARDIRRVGPRALVMRSVHGTGEIAAAITDGADALIASNGDHRADHAVITAAAATGKPVIAIGGIGAADVRDIMGAGAWGVAAIRALWNAADPGAAAREFLRELPHDSSVAVTINGEPGRAREGVTLSGLLADLGLDARAVVVEHNRRIVRRDDLARTAVSAGDAIELVHFVGGG